MWSLDRLAPATACALPQLNFGQATDWTSPGQSRQASNCPPAKCQRLKYTPSLTETNPTVPCATKPRRQMDHRGTAHGAPVARSSKRPIAAIPRIKASGLRCVVTFGARAFAVNCLSDVEAHTGHLDQLFDRNRIARRPLNGIEKGGHLRVLAFILPPQM